MAVFELDTALLVYLSLMLVLQRVYNWWLGSWYLLYLERWDDPGSSSIFSSNFMSYYYIENSENTSTWERVLHTFLIALGKVIRIWLWKLLLQYVCFFLYKKSQCIHRHYLRSYWSPPHPRRRWWTSPRTLSAVG